MSAPASSSSSAEDAGPLADPSGAGVAPVKAKRALPLRAVYIGTFRPLLDAKHRLTVPAKWRFQGDEDDNAYVAVPHENRSITVYPPWMMAVIMERLGGVSFHGDAEESLALQQALSGADKFGCDAQGRIVLSEELRRHAGLAKEALLIGTANIFHIWEPTRHAAYVAAPDGRRITNPAVLKRIGF